MGKQIRKVSFPNYQNSYNMSYNAGTEHFIRVILREFHLFLSNPKLTKGIKFKKSKIQEDITSLFP